MPHVKLKKHLLDIRQQAVFGRVQTRCGKFQKGQEVTRYHGIMWVKDWEGQVDYFPEEGKDYCQTCLRAFRADGQEEHELYGDKINGR